MSAARQRTAVAKRHSSRGAGNDWTPPVPDPAEAHIPSADLWRKVADLPPYLRHACVDCGLRHDQEIKIGVAVRLTYHADANRRSRAAGEPATHHVKLLERNPPR